MCNSFSNKLKKIEEIPKYCYNYINVVSGGYGDPSILEFYKNYVKLDF